MSSCASQTPGDRVGRKTSIILILAAATLLLCPPAALAQAPAAPAASARPAPRLTAVRTAEKIAIDGRLEEADWQRAQPAKDFLQKDPDEGQPASEATEVRFLFDDDAIYVGARMYDSEPSKISKRLTRRDGDTDGIADWIAVAFDARHDRLTGSIFWVSAAGSIGDGVIYNDSNDDDTWNGVWDAAASIDDKGWTAEMRIPFSQLRFTASDRQVWGLHVVRTIQRKHEEDWWALVRKSESGLASRMGDLDGLDGIRSRRHLELLPYATARADFNGTAESGNPFDDGRTGAGGGGLDVKWGITSNMTMDATVNPDFGQVEVDPAVVNLSVFETYFEEKRPFFIEGSQAFSRFGRNGASGSMGFNRSNPTLFYSRRIGRSPQGSASGDFVDRPASTTILGAAKVTGKTSGGWTVNFIDAVTSREWADTAAGSARGRMEVEPATNYLAARAYRSVGQRAGFGMLTTAVNRNLSDDELHAQLAGSALVVGGDGHWFLSDKRDYVVTGSLSGSRVAGSADAVSRLQRSSVRYFQRPDATHLTYDPAKTSLSGWDLQTDFSRNSGNVRPNVSFWAVSPGFEANDAGYSTTVDRMGMHAALLLLKQTPDRYSRSRSFLAAKWNVWNFAHDLLSDGYYTSFSSTLRNYWSFNVDVIRVQESCTDRLTRGGPMMRAPSGWNFSGELEGDERKSVVWSVQGSYESSADGSWSGASEVSLQFKPLPSLSIEVGPTLTRQLDAAHYVRAVTDESATAMFGKRYVFGDLDQTEWGVETRVNLILSPRTSLQMYLQPLLSVGRYSGFKEAAKPRTRDFLRYGEDIGSIAFDGVANAYRVTPGGAGLPFDFSNPDFNFKSLRVNAVYRWEFKPGSTLYAVWTQQRENEETDGPFSLNRGLSRLMRAPGDNVFMVKVSYWFGK